MFVRRAVRLNLSDGAAETDSSSYRYKLFPISMVDISAFLKAATVRATLPLAH
jgi:hypothetical protein